MRTVCGKLPGLFFVFVLLAGCGGDDEKNFSVNPQAYPVLIEEALPGGTLSGGTGRYPLAVWDSQGKRHLIEEPLTRVVSLGPNITEVFFALGQGGVLRGRTDWCDYPPEALDLPSVGDVMNPSLEVLLSLEPQLVIGSTHVPMETMALLEKSGIPTAILTGPQSFLGVYDIFMGAAAFSGALEAGEALCRETRERVRLVLDEVARRKPEGRPRVYYMIGYGDSGEWTAGGDTFIHQMIEMAGGDNIAGSVRGWSYSLEKLLEEDPEIILMNQGLKKEFCRTFPYTRLSAVKRDRVYEIPEDIIVRQGPRLIEGLELLAEIFRPEESPEKSPGGRG